MCGKVKYGLWSSVAIFAFASSSVRAFANTFVELSPQVIIVQYTALRLESVTQKFEQQRRTNSRGNRVPSLPRVVTSYAASRPRRGLACSSFSTKQNNGLINVFLADIRRQLSSQSRARTLRTRSCMATCSPYGKATWDCTHIWHGTWASSRLIGR